MRLKDPEIRRVAKDCSQKPQSSGHIEEAIYIRAEREPRMGRTSRLKYIHNLIHYLMYN